MPSVIAPDAWNNELAGQEPWPEDVKLYQPYEVEQILLPDMASCLSVQAFLKMSGLNYSVEYKANAEDMSPSGKVPFIKCGACLISDLEPIINFVASKGYSLSERLDSVQKSDMRAYMSLVNTVLGNAENYMTWVDSVTYSTVTKVRYGSVHPFPLNHILAYRKRHAVIRRLSAVGWYSKTLDKVYEEVDRCCRALSERLGSQRFFFGDSPTEVDAAVFGHTYAVLWQTSGPEVAGERLEGLGALVRSQPALVDHSRAVLSFLCPPSPHQLLPPAGGGGEPSAEALTAEAAGEEELHDSESEDFTFDPSAGDIACMSSRCHQPDWSSYINTANPIYESIFGELPPDLELGYSAKQIC